MSDSNFNFGLDNLKSSFNEEEDDSDYNKALNDETFENLDSDTDWELNHESYATSQGYPPDQGTTAVKTETAQAVDTDEVNDFDKKVRELGESVASYVLDGESDEIVPCQPSASLPPPSPSPWTQPQAQPQPQPQPHPSRQIMFVEDIEREMRQNASINPLSNINTNVPNLSVSAPHPADYRRRRVVPRLPFEARPPFYEHNPHAHPHHMRPPLGVAGPGQVRPRFAVPPHHYHQPQPPVAPHPPPVDEYAGLMTIGEKSWLVQIQLQQLNSSQANTNDYYFNQFQQKQQGASRKVNNHVVMKNNREVNNTSNKPIYAPLQFENSLGKLQVGSVMAPRKVIDMDVVDKLESNITIDQDSKKSKQLLMEVEEICLDMLYIEEYIHRPSSSCQIKNADMLACLQNRCLTQLCQENKLVSLMSVKKGKKAVHRLLPLLPDVAPIMKIFLTDLMTIVKKESKDDPTLLLSFLPAIRTFLANESLPFLNMLMSRYENSFYFSTQFTVSVMANIIERADILLEKCTDQGMIGDWKNRLVSLAQSAEYWKGDRPVVAIAADRLSRHLDLIKDSAAPEQISALTRVLSKPPQNAN